jgi:hypothetical protein
MTPRELEMVRAVFDVAVGSMDFSSGFLDQEEVDALRACAALLGVDPMVGTPEVFHCKYLGTHVPNNQYGGNGKVCLRCRQTIADAR